MDRMQRLPPELRKRIREYREHQPWESPIGAVPAYPDTYLESLKGMRPLRERIQRHVTSCDGYLTVTKIDFLGPGMAIISGDALTQFGDWQNFSLYLDAYGVFLLSQELEELDAGLRNHVNVHPNRPLDQQTHIARISEPLGMISPEDRRRFIRYKQPEVLRYCYELLDAIAQVHRTFENLADYEEGRVNRGVRTA